MRWSFSAASTFLQCQKKWYYDTKVANSTDSNPNRREAFRLAQLLNVAAWRGKLVDQVISSFIVPRISSGEGLDKEQVLNYADTLFEEQLRRANESPHGENGQSTDESLRFYELEYDTGVSDQAIEKARAEVKASLTNFLDSSLLRELTSNGQKLIAQRPLQFKFAGAAVIGMPDLIVFYRDRPPIIVDWKVHASMHKEHRLQLCIYGLALARAKPHKDFPSEWLDSIKDPTKVKLVEYQLLHNRIIDYTITQDDIVDVEDYIYTTSTRMQNLIDGVKDLPEQAVMHLPTAHYSSACEMCNFKKPCWRSAS